MAHKVLLLCLLASLSWVIQGRNLNVEGQGNDPELSSTNIGPKSAFVDGEKLILPQETEINDRQARLFFRQFFNIFRPNQHQYYRPPPTTYNWRLRMSTSSTTPGNIG